jgi:hypothetical protein
LDRLKPHRRAGTPPCGDAVVGVLPLPTIDACELGDVLLLAESRQPSFIGAGPDRLAPHRCRPFTWPLRGYARRALSRSQLAQTPSFVRSWIHRLERPIHPGACAPLPSSLWTFQSIADLLSHGSAANRLACASRLAKGHFDLDPPRRGPRSAEPKVSSILEEHLRQSRGRRLVDQVKLTTTPEGGTLSTTCSQPVDKCPRLFHPAA